MPPTVLPPAATEPQAARLLYRLLRERRSRRFARGVTLDGGPIPFTSAERPTPLSEEERALLSFAACGITGWALNDLGLGPGQGGTMMGGLVGRTIPSVDALQTVALVVTADDGTWFVKRGADLPPAEVRELIRLAGEEKYTEIFRRQSVRLADRRLAPPMAPPNNIPLNQWNAQAPGTTYFLPIADLTLPYINVALELFNEQNGVFPIDERAGFAPAGVGRFGRSRGGHLDDSGRNSAPIREFDMLMGEFVAIETGMMLQNLCLATEALGLGGFPNYAGSDVPWYQTLGFRLEHMPLSQFIGAGRVLRTIMRLRGLEKPMPVPIGLEIPDGEQLLRAYRPPYFPSMRAAVDAVIARKLGSGGIYREQALTNSAWKDPQHVASAIPDISDAAYEATVAFCEYVFARYGRFPAHQPAFRIHVGFQASHLDIAFYDRYYGADAVSPRHRQHLNGACGADG
jgi:hypothetical protein